MSRGFKKSTEAKTIIQKRLMVPEVPLSLLVWQIDVSVMKYVLMGLCPSECVVESGLLVLSITMPTLTFSFSAFLLHIKLSSHLCSDITSA